MKVTHSQIKQLVQNNPNNQKLGQAVRELLAKSENISEIYVDPNQVDLMDSINEITNKENGSRY